MPYQQYIKRGRERIASAVETNKTAVDETIQAITSEMQHVAISRNEYRYILNNIICPKLKASAERDAALKVLFAYACTEIAKALEALVVS